MKRRPPLPHPLDLALRDRFAREAGIDPAQLAAWLDWREPAPRAVVDRLVAAFFPIVPPESFRIADSEPLTPLREGRTIRTMRTEVSVARVGRPLKHMDHPLIAALAERGITLAEEARAVKRTPTAVRNYLYPSGEASSRPVPRELARIWHQKYGVPLSAWSRIQG